VWQKIPLHIHYAATLPHKIWNSEYTVYATNCSCIWIAYAAIPWSYSESLADEDRPVPPWRSGALLQFFHVLDLVLVNVVLTNPPHHIATDVIQTWTAGWLQTVRNEVLASFASTDRRTPLLDVPKPSHALKLSSQTVCVKFHKVV